MTIRRNQLSTPRFNPDLTLPFELRQDDIRAAVQDVYDFFFDVNAGLVAKGLERLDDMLRPAIMSGVLSDMLTASLAKHSRTLVVNGHFNGHPDLIVKGEYDEDAVKAGERGVEIKTTRKPGGAVDTHGARDQWMCVCLQGRQQPRAGSHAGANDLHRNLSGPGDRGRFQKKRARRTGHAHCHTAC